MIVNTSTTSTVWCYSLIWVKVPALLPPLLLHHQYLCQHNCSRVNHEIKKVSPTVWILQHHVVCDQAWRSSILSSASTRQIQGTQQTQSLFVSFSMGKAVSNMFLPFKGLLCLCLKYSIPLSLFSNSLIDLFVSSCVGCSLLCAGFL